MISSSIWSVSNYCSRATRVECRFSTKYSVLSSNPPSVSGGGAKYTKGVQEETLQLPIRSSHLPFFIRLIYSHFVMVQEWFFQKLCEKFSAGGRPIYPDADFSAILAKLPPLHNLNTWVFASPVVVEESHLDIDVAQSLATNLVLLATGQICEDEIHFQGFPRSIFDSVLREGKSCDTWPLPSYHMSIDAENDPRYLFRLICGNVI